MPPHVQQRTLRDVCKPTEVTATAATTADNVAAGSRSLAITGTGSFSLDDMDVTVIVVETER